MRIAVASGKGGTGKTTIATNLASMLAESGERVTYIDCDVDEPNGRLFLKPDIDEARDVNVPVAFVNEERCTGCGQCGSTCRYHALANTGKRVIIFPEMCRGCGACALSCPTGAISLIPRHVGKITLGRAGPLRFVEGRMNVGEVATTEIIRELKRLRTDGVAILDAPPGTACPAVEAIRNVDRTFLVTEPTPFGLHDLRLAVGVVRSMKVEAGVIINRCDVGDSRVRDYCREEGLDVLLEVRNDRKVAEAYAGGELPWRVVPHFRDAIASLAESLADLTARKSS